MYIVNKRLVTLVIITALLSIAALELIVRHFRFYFAINSVQMYATLLCGLDVRSLIKGNLHSLDFMVNHVLETTSEL